MRKIVLIVLVLILGATQSGSAQLITPQVLDQLAKAKEDTSKVNLLIKVSYLYANEDPAKAIRFSEDALLLAKKLKSEEQVMVALNRLGFNQFIAGDYSQALKNGLRSLQLAQKFKDSVAISAAYNTMGNIYRRQGNYANAIATLKLSISFSDKKGKTPVFSTLGITFLENGDIDSAMRYLQIAYQVSVQTKSPDASLMYNRLGDLQLALNNKRLAVEYYNTGIQSALANKLSRWLCFNYVSLSKLYLSDNKTDSSISYAHKAFDLGKNRFQQQAQAAAQILSDSYDKLNKPDSCLKYLRTAIQLNKVMLNNKEEAEIQNLTFEGRLQAIEAEAEEAKLKTERAHNLQNSAIAAILIVLILVFFLLSHSILVKESFIKALGILSLLVVFEFINLLIHPYLGELVHHSPLLMLIIMVLIAALLIPLHHKLEHWITGKMVEKNRKIRLAAAKKTIEQLEK